MKLHFSPTALVPEYFSKCRRFCSPAIWSVGSLSSGANTSERKVALASDRIQTQWLLQHLGIKAVMFTAASVHIKVDNLKRKARDHYKRLCLGKKGRRNSKGCGNSPPTSVTGMAIHVSKEGFPCNFTTVNWERSTKIWCVFRSPENVELKYYDTLVRASVKSAARDAHRISCVNRFFSSRLQHTFAGAVAFA